MSKDNRYSRTIALLSSGMIFAFMYGSEGRAATSFDEALTRIEQEIASSSNVTEIAGHAFGEENQLKSLRNDITLDKPFLGVFNEMTLRYEKYGDKSYLSTIELKGISTSDGNWDKTSLDFIRTYKFLEKTFAVRPKLLVSKFRPAEKIPLRIDFRGECALPLTGENIPRACKIYLRRDPFDRLNGTCKCLLAISCPGAAYLAGRADRRRGEDRVKNERQEMADAAMTAYDGIYEQAVKEGKREKLLAQEEDVAALNQQKDSLGSFCRIPFGRPVEVDPQKPIGLPLLGIKAIVPTEKSEMEGEYVFYPEKPFRGFTEYHLVVSPISKIVESIELRRWANTGDWDVAAEEAEVAKVICKKYQKDMNVDGSDGGMSVVGGLPLVGVKNSMHMSFNNAWIWLYYSKSQFDSIGDSLVLRVCDRKQNAKGKLEREELKRKKEAAATKAFLENISESDKKDMEAL